MKYTVVWHPKAEEELAAIWVDAADRGLIVRAAETLDRELSVNPLEAGESRSHSLRITYSLPLGIRFEISEDDRLVTVLAVWQCHRLNR